MKIITPESTRLSLEQKAVFAQGAGVIVSDHRLSAGLWFDHTPGYQGKKIGTIGACQIDDSPEAADFLSHCANYLNENHHCCTIVGPMDGNTWLQHRLVIESDGRDPFLMEPMEPMHFYNTFAAAGFTILAEYSSSLIDLTQEQKNYAVMASRLEKNGVTFRRIDPENFEHDLGAIFDLSLVSFTHNFLYTPLPKTAFVKKYMTSRQHIDPDLVILAERYGELAGYVFCMPDLMAHELGKKPAIIIKTLATQPERSLSGVGTVLVSKAQKTAQQKGYTEAIHALQHESNSSLRISQRFNATVFRRYALMAKSFT